MDGNGPDGEQGGENDGASDHGSGLGSNEWWVSSSGGLPRSLSLDSLVVEQHPPLDQLVGSHASLEDDVASGYARPDRAAIAAGGADERLRPDAAYSGHLQGRPQRQRRLALSRAVSARRPRPRALRVGGNNGRPQGKGVFAYGRRPNAAHRGARQLAPIRRCAVGDSGNGLTSVETPRSPRRIRRRTHHHLDALLP